MVKWNNEYKYEFLSTDYNKNEFAQHWCNFERKIDCCATEVRCVRDLAYNVLCTVNCLDFETDQRVEDARRMRMYCNARRVRVLT